jgi:predicted transcriptional regulator
MERLELVYNIIQKNPAIRFNDIMRISKLKNGTLTHYISKLEKSKKIHVERTPRISRFYDISIPPKEAVVCKQLTRPTVKNIIVLLLEKNVLTFPEIRDHVKKSPATVSVCLNNLFHSGIIEKTYDIPSNKYSLKNSTLIKGVLNVYFPSLGSKLVDNTTELLDF